MVKTYRCKRAITQLFGFLAAHYHYADIQFNSQSALA